MVSLSFAVAILVAISRTYITKLQDRIIMLEMKVRCAELLPAGKAALLSKLSPKQVVALRFASDEELGALLERSISDNLPPRGHQAVDQELASRLSPNLIIQPASAARVEHEEKLEVLQLIEAHERTLAICRACAQTARDLAWEIKRGAAPGP